MLVKTVSDVNRVLKRLRKVMLIFQKPRKNTHLDPTLSNNMSHFTEQHSPVEQCHLRNKSNKTHGYKLKLSHPLEAKGSPPVVNIFNDQLCTCS